MNQSKLELNTCTWCEALENECERIMIGFGFTSDWMEKRDELFKGWFPLVRSQSRSRSRSRKSAYDLVKIANRSRKRSQAWRNRGRKSQNVSISSDSVYDPVTYDPVKTRLSESEAKAKEPNNHKPRIEHCDWFILFLLPSLTMKFSRDHKRQSHKRIWYSASDSVGLICTRSYISLCLWLRLKKGRR